MSGSGSTKTFKLTISSEEDNGARGKMGRRSLRNQNLDIDAQKSGLPDVTESGGEECQQRRLIVIEEDETGWLMLTGARTAVAGKR